MHAGRWSAPPLLLRCVLLPLHAHILSILHKFHLHAQHTTRGFDCDGGASTGVSSRAIKPPGFGVHAHRHHLLSGVLIMGMLYSQRT